MIENHFGHVLQKVQMGQCEIMPRSIREDGIGTKLHTCLGAYRDTRKEANILFFHCYVVFESLIGHSVLDNQRVDGHFIAILVFGCVRRLQHLGADASIARQYRLAEGELITCLMSVILHQGDALRSFREDVLLARVDQGDDNSLHIEAQGS